MDFIIDRTSEDVAYAQSFITQTWSKMTNEQKEEWLKGLDNSLYNLKGFFNWNDMRRIRNNYNSLKNTYSYSGEQITTSYTMSTIPNRTIMSGDFNKIKEFGASTYIPEFVEASFVDYRTPITLSSDVNKMDYNFLNNYEHILKNLYDYNNDGYLIIDCDYDVEETQIELDGILSVYEGTIKTIVPSGYVAKIQKGIYQQSTWQPTSTVISTDGEEVATELSPPTNFYNLIVESGIANDNYVINYSTSGNSFDVTNYDTVRLDSDLLRYSQPTTYTATEIQSSMIDVSSLVKMYCYDISVMGNSTIVTLYDENQDMFDEIALREDTEVDLTNTSYITFDTDIGTEITYITTDGTSGGNIYIQVGSTNYVYPTDTEFDVSEVNTIKLMNPAPYSNKMLVKMQKSIEGGKDISQLDLSEIEVKYI